MGVTAGDDPAFVRIVASILDSVIADLAPETVTVVQIRNWFGPRWRNFSGKLLGDAGLWKADITLPPFHPKRVMSQTDYRFSGGKYEPVEARTLHVVQRSSDNQNRKLRLQTNSGVFAWWTSNTVANGRGSLMVYAQFEDRPSTWFLGFSKKDGDWILADKRGIADPLLKKYMGSVE